MTEMLGAFVCHCGKRFEAATPEEARVRAFAEHDPDACSRRSLEENWERIRAKRRSRLRSILESLGRQHGT